MSMNERRKVLIERVELIPPREAPRHALALMMFPLEGATVSAPHGAGNFLQALGRRGESHGG
jgi:hypothetical protein